MSGTSVLSEKWVPIIIFKVLHLKNSRKRNRLSKKTTKCWPMSGHGCFSCLRALYFELLPPFPAFNYSCHLVLFPRHYRNLNQWMIYLPIKARNTSKEPRWTTLINKQLEMWVNAQRDSRPAVYRWRPLFNAAVWLCSNAAKTRNQLKFAGVPQTNETISAASEPKFTIL